MNLCYVDIQNTKYQKLSNDLPLKIYKKLLTDLKIVGIRNHETIYHSKWFLGDNHKTTNSSAITLKKSSA